MKKQSNQKWLLPTLLIAALGSQYYFSVSSKNMSVVEMASTDLENQILAVTSILDKKIVLEKPRNIGPIDTSKPKPLAYSWSDLSTNSDKATTNITDNSSSLIQTESSVIEKCDSCVTLTKEEYQKTLELLKKLSEEKKVVSTTEKVEKKEKDDEEKVNCNDKESKVLRKRCEKNQKRIAEKEAQEDRDDKFEEKYEELAENCDMGVDAESDLKCYADSFSDALKRFKGKGSGKNKGVSESVVRKVYNKNIKADLKQALTDPENEDALEALETLMSEIPAGYKSIKTDVIREARDASAQVAILAQNDFKLAEEYRRTGRTQEANQLFTNALEQKTTLINMLGKHREAIKVGTSEDRETWRKYETGYAKEAIQWVNNIMGNSHNLSNDPFGNNPDKGNSVIRGGGANGVGSNRGHINSSNFNNNQNNVFGNNPQGTQINNGQPGLSGSRTRNGAINFNPF